MTTALLPCPFCGGEASMVRNPHRYYVRCLECSQQFELGTEQEACDAWNRRALAPQAGDNAEEPVAPIVNITTGMRELRASLIARTVRQSLRNYGHKSAESTLPECIAVDVERALVADEKLWSAPQNAPALEDKGGDA